MSQQPEPSPVRARTVGAGEAFRVGFVEWPSGLTPRQAEAAYDSILSAARLDLLILNELPFGAWLAARPLFDGGAAERSIGLHEEGLAWLASLPIRAIITSRPILAGARLMNEAVQLAGGEIVPLHRKKYLPDEPGWFEAAWYRRGDGPSEPVPVGNLLISTLLCTEAMFNEHARRAGRRGAHVVAIPRATAGIKTWQAAAEMAAIVSGAYVISSNRAGDGFSGAGFAYGPDGGLIELTSAEHWLRIVDVDLARANRRKAEYPCYVPE